MIKKGLGFTFILVWALGIGADLSAQSIKTVRLMSRAPGTSVLIYEIGNKLGFYREAGIYVEPVIARISTSAQAVMGGSATYINHGSTVPAILRGVPFRVLLVDADRPPHYIVTSSKISNFKELIGKKIAVDDFAGASAMMVRDTLVANGIPVSKVSLRILGPPPVRFQALLAGAVDAAPLNFLMSRKLEKEGFRILAYTGDYTSDVQLTAAAEVKKIQKSPKEIYKFVKASLKAQIFMFENPNDDAYKIFLEATRLADGKLARDTFQARLKRSSELVRIGRLSEEAMIETINRVKKQLELGGVPLKAGKTVKPTDVFDLSFAKRAYKELKAEGWDPKKVRYIKKK